MTHVLLDTNAYVAFKEGHQEVMAILQHAELIGLSIVVLGELVAGFTVGTKYQKNMQELNAFLSTPRIRIFPIDETTTTFYAQIYANLRRKGNPIPSNDLWIAATTLQQGYQLCSFDKHFHNIENLIVVTQLNDFILRAHS